MATTTNYGWTTPDDTALVKDGASAIRSLGTSVDTTTKALNPSTTLGDIEYRSSTANTNTRLAIGTTGQVLTVAGGVPSWATPAGGGGKVLQVVYGDTTTSTTIASTSYADTGLSASITPSSATSKVLVFCAQNNYITRAASSGGQGATFKLLRGSTDVFVQQASSTSATTLKAGLGADGTIDLSVITPINYLDSPNTTSSTTYKIQGKALYTVNSGSLICQVENTRSSIVLMEIGA
jgi:hypothetical protein